MDERTESELLAAMLAGDEKAFEGVYGVFQERVRLVAWRVSHRPDWVDDIFNEAWCRAYKHRLSFDQRRPFLVWMAGIVRNIYREECRRSTRTWAGAGLPDDEGVASEDNLTPEAIAEEAELLSALNDCVAQLSEDEAKVVQMRFFDGLPLRVVAQKVGIPEATLRDGRIPVIYRTLRECLQQKGIRFSELFPAQ